jgi:hypothetical protein
VEVVLRGQAWSRYHEVVVRVPRLGTVDEVRVAAEAAVRSRGGGAVHADTASLRFSLRHAFPGAAQLDPAHSLVSVGILRNGHPLVFDATSATRFTPNV